MDFLDFDCPIRYPNKCNLLPEEYEPLADKKRYVVFVMYQFEGNGPARGAISEYFTDDKYRLLDAKDEPALGVKICKICRLALAADFGIASLSPLNHNVMLEIGMMLGMQKPVLFILDTNKGHPENMPFDLSQEIVIPYSSPEGLRQGFKREEPLFLGKVGKTAEYREIRIVLEQVLKEFEINGDIDRTFRGQPPPGGVYRTFRLGRLLETGNVPEDIRHDALNVYWSLESVNSILALVPVMEPIVGKKRITLINQWAPIKGQLDSGVSSLRNKIQLHLNALSQRKPSV